MVTETKLSFEAKIVGDLKVKMGNQHGGGSVVFTLQVDQPKLPARPEPYSFDLAPWGRTELRPRPADPKRKRGESDEEYEARCTPTRVEQERYDGAVVRYEAALAEYREKAGKVGAQLRAYAGLVGIASLFGDRPILVDLTPSNQDLLPGFGANFLEGPASDAGLDTAALDSDEETGL